MQVFYKSLYMKYEPRFDPKLPKDLSEKQLTSTYFEIHNFQFENVQFVSENRSKKKV